MKLALFICLFILIQPLNYIVEAQIDFQKRTIGGKFQLAFEEQSYIETALHNSNLVDIEKHAGICISYKTNIFREAILKNNLLINYSFAYLHFNQKYYYSEILSSDFDYLEMGLSRIRGDYIGLSTGLSYKRNNRQGIHIVPQLNIGLNILINKYEKVTQLKYSFASVQEPYSKFKHIIPEISLDVLLSCEPQNLNWGFYLGPGLKNNPKYYHEDKGVLSFPIAFCLNICILKTI